LLRAVQFRQQVIVATPDINESRTLAAWLEGEGFEVIQRSSARSAIDTIGAQPFDLLIADCGFTLTGGVRAFGLARVRETPVVVLGDAGAESSCAPFGSQIMFLERPLDRAIFICMVTMALMDARAERKSPRRAVKPFEAAVNGVPSHIIDVSREGVRLELPRDRRMITPQFVVRVPLIGVGVSVQRVWVRVPGATEPADRMWCGGQLTQNQVVAQQGWQRFIDTLVSAKLA
jgi:hypothetical protein